MIIIKFLKNISIFLLSLYIFSCDTERTRDEDVYTINEWVEDNDQSIVTFGQNLRGDITKVTGIASKGDNLYVIGWSNEKDLDGSIGHMENNHSVFLSKLIGFNPKYTLQYDDPNIGSEGLKLYVDEEENSFILSSHNSIYKIRKINSNGILVFEKDLSNSYSTGDYLSFVVDLDGNIYLTNSTSGALSGYSQQGVNDIYVVKIDSNGNSLWHRQIGSDKQDQSRNIALDSNNNIYIVGGTCGRISGGSTPDCSNTIRAHYIVLKYDNNGNELWKIQDYTDKILDIADDHTATHIIIDKNNDFYIFSAGTKKFILKFNSNGSLLWEKEILTPFSINSEPHDMKQDQNGNLFLLFTVTGKNQYLFKYDSEGKLLMFKELNQTREHKYFSINERYNTIYLGGRITSSIPTLSGVEQGIVARLWNVSY